MTWYATPEAVALLDSFTRRPHIKRAKDHTWSSSYGGRRAEALAMLWFNCYGESREQTPFHVLGAIFGDPNGTGSCWDGSREWAAIRAKLAATGGLTARRVLRQQKGQTNE